MANNEDRKIAGQLLEAIRGHDEPNAVEIDHLADTLDADPVEVRRILDEYLVRDNGQIVHRGPGQGGGWIT